MQLVDYTKIAPGTYLDKNGKIVYMLKMCSYCGGAWTMSHSKYSDKCNKCGKLYNLYTVRRSKRKNGTLSYESLVAHLEVINEWLTRKKQGLRTPRSVDREYELTVDAIATALSSHDTHIVVEEDSNNGSV